MIWRNVGDLVAKQYNQSMFPYPQLVVIQAVPLIVTAAAALFLGEKVGCISHSHWFLWELY